MKFGLYCGLAACTSLDSAMDLLAHRYTPTRPVLSDREFAMLARGTASCGGAPTDALPTVSPSYLVHRMRSLVSYGCGRSSRVWSNPFTK